MNETELLKRSISVCGERIKSLQYSLSRNRPVLFLTGLLRFFNRIAAFVGLRRYATVRAGHTKMQGAALAGAVISRRGSSLLDKQGAASRRALLSN